MRIKCIYLRTQWTEATRYASLIPIMQVVLNFTGLNEKKITSDHLYNIKKKKKSLKSTRRYVRMNGIKTKPHLLIF